MTVDLDAVYLLNLFLYTNIDHLLQHKSHRPMHYKIGDTCVYNGHLLYTLL